MVKLKTSILMFLLIGLTALAAFAVGKSMMSIQVKKGELRLAPSFLGKIVAQLYYGDRVYVLENKGSWSKVGLSAGAAEGWIHASALTPKVIVLKAGAKDVEAAASGDELALAGKGFNQQVESEFRAKNPNLDFTWIDKMETYVVSEQEMKRFLKKGELSPEGGF
ncbi:MAG: SH3 domain-containing protein [Desulfobacterales bacterium]|nr:MAG: SH3 domain-containing protein [Desulfobacterales bacterium]